MKVLGKKVKSSIGREEEQRRSQREKGPENRDQVRNKGLGKAGGHPWRVGL